MFETSRTAYLFQCEGEDLYAVSHDITGANIPRSPCTQGWHLCGAFELGRRLAVPAPVMPEPILKGIADVGYFVWRGWSDGQSERPKSSASPPEWTAGRSRAQCAIVVRASRTAKDAGREPRQAYPKQYERFLPFHSQETSWQPSISCPARC